MKKKYLPAELEIILLYQDVITTSIGGGAGNEPGIDDGTTGSGGSGIGGGHNPGGWT